MEDSDQLMTKINDMGSITDSQKDRFESQKLIQENLIEFLDSQIHKVSSKNSLRETVISELKERISPDKEDEEAERLTSNQLLNLFSILSKDENDSVANILSVIKDKQNTIINIPIGNDSSGRDSHFTQDDISKTKKLLNIFDLVDRIKASELSLEELENKKNID